jgi:hypothetical protein
MTTYYLVLPVFDDSYFIKRCKAEDKKIALDYFKNKMDKLAGNDMYAQEDLLSCIKLENELNERERKLIKEEAEIVDL